MNSNYIVYVHKNKINNKLYIGITSQSLVQRSGICGNKYRKCTYFYNAIQKYGWDNFEHIVLIENLTKEVACICETYLINKYNTTNEYYGYNLRYGGEHPTHTEMSKKRISENHADFSGMNHPNYGKHLSLETKLKISKSHTGYKHDEKFKKEHSDRMKGHKNPRAKRVRCVNTGEIFDTARLAAKWSNQCDGSNIGKCCKGLSEFAGVHPETKERLKWEYIT